MLLTIDADVSSAVDLLSDVERRLTDSQSVRMLGQLLAEWETEVFETEGQGQWPALSPDTLRQKSGSRILVDTGSLLDALTGAAEVSDDAAVLKAPEHAKYHRGRRDPMPDPDLATLSGWADDLVNYIVDGRGR